MHTNLKLALPVIALAAAFGGPAANAENASAKAERVAIRGGGSQHFALVRPGRDGTSGSGNEADWKDIEAAKRAIAGEFLWFRQDGKAYVVRDAGVVAKVVDAWAPVDRLGVEMDGYGREMDKHGKKMEALGRQMERQPTHDLGQQMKEASKPMDALGKQMNVLGKQLDIEARAAEKATRALIRDAMAKGLAAPAPVA
jgi:hypothetical protein